MQLLGKNVTAATNTQATAEGLLEKSMRLDLPTTSWFINHFKKINSTEFHLQAILYRF
jgi:hypothetical protein